MLHRDYLMRIIEQLVVALERILHLEASGQHEQAEAEIRTACRTIFGFDLSFIEPLADADIITLLGGRDHLDTPKCYALGILLARHADLRSTAGDEPGSVLLSVKALTLLAEAALDAGAPIATEHSPAVDKLVARLEAFEIPHPLRQTLFRYYETIGRYDKAENTLFDILSTDGAFRESGVDFYHRLMQKTDAELAAGNLPREEVEEGLTALSRMDSRV